MFDIATGTILPWEPGEFASAVYQYSGVSNLAQSYSVASVIARGDPEELSKLPAPSATFVSGNYGDLGRAPPILSYYLGPQGVNCIESVSGDVNWMPGGCATLWDDYYVPLVRLPSAARSLNSGLWLTCDLSGV